MTHTMQERSFAAPGRVNLIGEHTDYTGGLVMPLAIPFATTATISAAADGMYRLRTDRYSSVRVMPLEDRSPRVGDWSDYPVGVLRELQKLGIKPAPFDLKLQGNVPLAAGLSSSASIEVATAVALLAQAGVTMPAKEIAQLCQRAENLYVHSPCGIMDQFVVTAAVAGDALLLHTRELTYDLLPLDVGAMAETRIVVLNSEVKHSIAEGEYGNRRKEVEAGQSAVLARYPDLLDLGQATLRQLESCRGAMSPVSYKRCHHIVTENARVREAAAAMRAGDPVELGRLLTAAHASMRDDFEASCEEIDFLVETATHLPGCHGARMTGGGFGGCTVNLVDATQVEAFTAAVVEAYRDRFGIEAQSFVCTPSDGALARAAAGKEVQA